MKELCEIPGCDRKAVYRANKVMPNGEMKMLDVCRVCEHIIGDGNEGRFWQEMVRRQAENAKKGESLWDHLELSRRLGK